MAAHAAGERNMLADEQRLRPALGRGIGISCDRYSFGRIKRPRQTTRNGVDTAALIVLP
jgi:hypothetical protein